MKVMENHPNNTIPNYIAATLRSFLEAHDLNSPVTVKRTEKEDKEGSGSEELDASAAFLGPTLWEKTLPDFKLEYMDLDDFLNDQNENNDPKSKPHTLNQPSQNTDISLPLSPHSSCEAHSNNDGSITPGPDLSDQSSSDMNQDASTDSSKKKVPVNFKVAPADLELATVPGHQHFDPCNHTFSEDELRPQAIIKKSRKQFVPDQMKDDKYWARRNKNNQAAKRSREARRVKENQIVLRASYLEKENFVLKEELNRLKEDNEKLWQRLQKYEGMPKVNFDL